MAKKKKLQFGDKTFDITNLEKVFWPNLGITKEELIDYYIKIAPFMLPYLEGRPESLHRFPNGATEKGFYQKDIDHQFPEWIERWTFEGEEKTITYLLCQDEATLVYMAQLGCIEINPWNSRFQSPNYPDYCVIDLDPLDIPFDAVLETALATHKILDRYEIRHYPKTSGATGIHIYIPLGAQYTHEQSKRFAEIVAHLVNKEMPKITSVERLSSKRKGKVYIDYLQNNLGQTIASVYSVRPNKFAGVSTPVSFEEIEKGFKPNDFNIRNIFDRLKLDYLFRGIIGDGANLNDILKNLTGR